LGLPQRRPGCGDLSPPRDGRRGVKTLPAPGRGFPEEGACREARPTFSCLAAAAHLFRAAGGAGRERL
jgi:hypothetical protein